MQESLYEMWCQYQFDNHLQKIKKTLDLGVRVRIKIVVYQTMTLSTKKRPILILYFLGTVATSIC